MLDTGCGEKILSVGRRLGLVDMSEVPADVLAEATGGDIASTGAQVGSFRIRPGAVSGHPAELHALRTSSSLCVSSG